MPSKVILEQVNTTDRIQDDDQEDSLNHREYVERRSLLHNESEKGHFHPGVGIPMDEQGTHDSKEWLRPYWLGTGLFLALFSFWILDSLKDPILGVLTQDLEQHQPTAKLFSVATTVGLVLLIEYISHHREEEQRKFDERQYQQNAGDSMREDSQPWARMSVGTSDEYRNHEISDSSYTDKTSIFVSIGIPYVVLFGVIAYFLQFNHTVNNSTDAKATGMTTDTTTFWTCIGYVTFAAIESFGSIIVATFWSYVNSTLSLAMAEQYYGLVVAIAQLGAIGGSTMVTSNIWTHVTLIILACLVLVLHILVMVVYGRTFQPTSSTLGKEKDTDERTEPTLWSGLHLILKHNYVILILGVSCLYEVSLTCLNYQMTLLGYKRFSSSESSGASFAQFMGYYGQLVNITSLFISSVAFPYLIRRYGLKYTLRIFPTLLVLVNIIAFGALPGNLVVLFISLAILKAMTYSIQNPSEELLYLPTSDSIKFKSKFWIDVVGARVAKAIGSSINNFAGSVDKSIRVASAPSLLTAAALWYTCYRAGLYFDRLVATKSIVGTDTSDPRSIDKFQTLTEPGNTEAEPENIELAAM